MNQHHFNLINGEDTFFLTFLGAWVSVRIATWGVDKPFNLIMLIIAILCFSILIAQIRFWIQNGKKNTQISIKLYSAGAFVFFIFSLQHLYYEKYLSSSDLYVLGGLSILWIILALLENQKYHNFTVSHEPPTPPDSQAKQAV
ncbi:hypothetical protein ACVCK3_20810 [Bacillus cereus]|nr:hypothetical protein [Bacillus cereus]